MVHLRGTVLTLTQISTSCQVLCWQRAACAHRPQQESFLLTVNLLRLCHLWHCATFDIPLTAGEMFHFGYELQKAPFLRYGWTDATGNLQADMPITRGKDRVRVTPL